MHSDPNVPVGLAGGFGKLLACIYKFGHFQGCSCATCGMACIFQRHAAHQHIGVANGFKPFQAVALRDGVKCREACVKFLQYFLGSQALADSAEADKIGEDDGDGVIALWF